MYIYVYTQRNKETLYVYIHIHVCMYVCGYVTYSFDSADDLSTRWWFVPLFVDVSLQVLVYFDV